MGLYSIFPLCGQVRGTQGLSAEAFTRAVLSAPTCSSPCKSFRVCWSLGSQQKGTSIWTEDKETVCEDSRRSALWLRSAARTVPGASVGKHSRACELLHFPLPGVVAAHACHPRTREADTRGPWSLLARQLSRTGFRLRNPVLRTKRPLSSMHNRMCTCMCTHTNCVRWCYYLLPPDRQTTAWVKSQAAELGRRS